ncbi:MAG: ATP-binding protein [Candidatus Kapabacteria bacterium]|nr:ATP-binding protein [Candidatus Kapabacteria bacterium]
MSIFRRSNTIDIIDELGYIELNKKNASLFFQLIAIIYEKKSIFITTNKPFVQWGQVFGDNTVATAIIDRLLHLLIRFLLTEKVFV